MSEPTGTLIRGLLSGGAVRLLLVEAAALAEHTRLVHRLGPGATRLSAEAVVVLAIASAHIKGEEALVLQIQGEEPRFSVYADLTGDGALRARSTPSEVEVGDDGRVLGMMLVIKQLGHREVYRGVTAIASESLEQAFARHLGSSDQVDAVLGVHTELRPDGSVKTAAGWLIERLPDDPSAPSLDPAAFVERYAPLATRDRAETLTRLAFGSLGEDDPVEVLDRRELAWRCRCSVTRIEDMLVSLGPTELTSMADEDRGAEVTCHFCNTAYQVTEARLRDLARSIAIA